MSSLTLLMCLLRVSLISSRLISPRLVLLHGDQIEYSIPTYLDLLQKPLVAAAALAIVFLSIIFMRRLETSIGK